MELEKGMTMKVIQGIPQNYRGAWMETGDIVTVREVYDHVILVERPFRDRKRGILRECYRRNVIHKYLRPV